MKFRFFVLALLAVLACACQPKKICPPESVTQLPEAEILQARPAPAADGLSPTSTQVKVGGRLIDVDQVVSGPLCYGDWKGTVYVGCSVQVAEWTDLKRPTFLEKCDLTIEPGTVVYVAAHNDTAYYNGCSCHTGSVSEQTSLQPKP